MHVISDGWVAFGDLGGAFQDAHIAPSPGFRYFRRRLGGLRPRGAASVCNCGRAGHEQHLGDTSRHGARASLVASARVQGSDRDRLVCEQPDQSVKQVVLPLLVPRRLVPVLKGLMVQP